MLFWNKGLPSFDSENDMNVKLGIGISHDVFPLGNFSHVAPLGLNAPVRSRFPDPLHLCGGFITFHASRFTPSDHYIKKPLINQPHRNSIIGELHVNIV